MKTKIKFGKVAYINKRIATNDLNVEIRLEQKECINYETMQPETMWVFAASGELWNGRSGTHRDIVMGGQCLDSLVKLMPKNPLLKEIHDIWAKYHLNDITAGTIKQDTAIKSFIENGWKYEYEEACKMLETIDLYIDNGYKYGTKWLCKPIPQNIVDRIKEIFESEKAKYIVSFD